MVREWLRKLLGLDNITTALVDLECKMDKIEDQLDSILHSLRMLDRLTRVHEQALARIVAKLDPMFGVDELDPKRKAESNRLADGVLNKLYAEDWARKHTEGKV
jgi:hypothetical protein